MNRIGACATDGNAMTIPPPLLQQQWLEPDQQVSYIHSSYHQDFVEDVSTRLTTAHTCPLNIKSRQHTVPRADRLFASMFSSINSGDPSFTN